MKGTTRVMFGGVVVLVGVVDGGIVAVGLVVV